MDIKQSWLITTSKGVLTLYEARLIVKIVETAQAKIKETYITRGVGRLFSNCDDLKVTLPIKYILTENSNHYEDVEDAAKKLAKRTMEIYDPDTKTWRFSPIIFDIQHTRRTGTISFRVYGHFLDSLYNFTLGFSRYDLETAMQLKTAYSIRLFMILYGQTKPQEYSLKWLKELFGVTECYKQNADFIKKCITPSIKAINETCYINIDMHKMIEKGKITKLRFTVSQRERLQDKNISEQKKYITGLLGRDIEIELMSGAGFTYRELSAHRALLERLVQHPMATQLVLDICHRARKQSKTKGYIINALRSELKQ